MHFGFFVGSCFLAEIAVIGLRVFLGGLWFALTVTVTVTVFRLINDYRVFFYNGTLKVQLILHDHRRLRGEYFENALYKASEGGLMDVQHKRNNRNRAGETGRVWRTHRKGLNDGSLTRSQTRKNAYLTWFTLAQRAIEEVLSIILIVSLLILLAYTHRLEHQKPYGSSTTLCHWSLEDRLQWHWHWRRQE